MAAKKFGDLDARTRASDAETRAANYAKDLVLVGDQLRAEAASRRKAEQALAAAEAGRREAEASVAWLVAAIRNHVNENSTPKMDGSRAYPRVSERWLIESLASLPASAKAHVERVAKMERVVEAARGVLPLTEAEDKGQTLARALAALDSTGKDVP